MPGFSHPYCTQTDLLLARIALDSDRVDDAQRLALQARDTSIKTYGEHGPEVGRPFLVLGQIATRHGQREAALAAFDRGITELEPDSAAGRIGRLLRADALYQFGDVEGASAMVAALQPAANELGAIERSRLWTLAAELATARGDSAALRIAQTAFESSLPDVDPHWIARREALQCSRAGSCAR